MFNTVFRALLHNPLHTQRLFSDGTLSGPQVGVLIAIHHFSFGLQFAGSLASSKFSYNFLSLKKPSPESPDVGRSLGIYWIEPNMPPTWHLSSSQVPLCQV